MLDSIYEFIIAESEDDLEEEGERGNYMYDRGIAIRPDKCTLKRALKNTQDLAINLVWSSISRFCMLPLEFGRILNIHKHMNSRILQFHVKTPISPQ